MHVKTGNAIICQNSVTEHVYSYCMFICLFPTVFVYWAMTFKKKKCILLCVGLSCLVFAFLPAHSLFKGKPSGALVVKGVLRFVIKRHHVLKTLHRYLNSTSVFNVAAQLSPLNYRITCLEKRLLVPACRKMVKNALLWNDGLISPMSWDSSWVIKSNSSIIIPTYVSFQFLHLIMLHTMDSSFRSTLIIHCSLLNHNLILMLLSCLYGKGHCSD